MTSPNVQEADESILKYQQFGSQAAHLGVFNYLCTMIRHPMYGDRYSVIGRIVRQTIYNILNELCDLFDDDGSMARHKYIFQLLSELLKTYSIAKDFIGRNGKFVQVLIKPGHRTNFCYRYRRKHLLVQHSLQQFPR